MAEVSMKDIKLRIKSVENTRQITKAMELVASSKLRRAKERAERSRPFFSILQSVMDDISSGSDSESIFTKEKQVKNSCYIVIAGDRGLAGGYNNNVLDLAEVEMKNKNAVILPIGKKALEHFKRVGANMITSDFESVEDISVKNCHEISKVISSGFADGDFDEAYIVYTKFISVLSQEPSVVRILPVAVNKNKESKKYILYEPDSEAVFNAIIPDYIAGVLWGSVSESLASELGARRTAMEAATKNAGEMIDSLSLKYNRARQGAITQEITEIVSGSEL